MGRINVKKREKNHMLEGERESHCCLLKVVELHFEAVLIV